MGECCEFEIDFEQFDDLRAVVVHDECGAHEDVWFYRFDGLKAENAKLRELVRIAIEYCVNGYCAEEDECPLYESRNSCTLYAKARELGVEVDE